MAVDFLDLKRGYRSLQPQLDAALMGVVESQRFILGAPVEELEEAVREYTGAAYAVACASGTDALLLSLRALELEPGSEVIVPAFTFFATAGAVWNAGLKPVFVDVDPMTFNMTVDLVEEAVGPKTRAVIPVHLFGDMVDMESLMDLADARGLKVIEDAAQAFGSQQRTSDGWRHAGTLGDTGCYSFFPTKNLGGYGDGGMVVTGNQDLATKLAKLRVHGGRQMYDHELVGTNSRLDALQAAVLRVKLTAVTEWVMDRRKCACFYNAALVDVWGTLQVPMVVAGNAHSYNLYTVQATRRDQLREYLGERGIGCGVYYPVPLHLQRCFAELGYGEGDFPISEYLSKVVLSLPIYPELTTEEIDEVADAIRSFYY